MANLLIFTNTRFDRDFRKYLMRAAESAGGRAVHFYADAENILSYGGVERQSYTDASDAERIRSDILRVLGDGPTIGLTGLGVSDSPVAMRLHRTLLGVSWIYDVYDDFLYNAEGLDSIRRQVMDAVWQCRCARTIILDIGLQNRYRNAYHLNNASHLEYISASNFADAKKMIYIGSIDKRVDMAWLGALAAHGVTIDIYGSVHSTAPEMQGSLENLLASHSNVKFHGGYDNDDLPDILSNYRVGLLPYRVLHPMTNHVNPDKLHHYLNAGLEVLSSPIPATMRNARYIHLIETNGNWGRALEELEKNPRHKAWPRKDFTWKNRWDELERYALSDDILV